MVDARRPATAWLAAAAVVALLWSGLLLLVPGWLAHAAGPPASGARAVVAGLTYLAASRVCHQRPERSFRLHDRPLPVCGRCTALYLSGTLGLLTGVPTWRRARSVGAAPPLGRPAGRHRRIIWLALSAMPTALTWSLEMAGVWNPGTLLRALAALPLGLAGGLLIAARGR